MALAILQRLEALERQVAQMNVRGKIVEVDYDNHKAKVKYGENQTTGWLPWKPIRAGKAIVWWPLEVGEAVTVLSPGDLTLGEIFPASYQNDFPAPSNDPDLFLIQFDDETSLSYHSADKKLIATLPDDGTTLLTSKGGITLVGDTVIDGNITITENAVIEGTTHSNGDVSCDANVSDQKSTMQIIRDVFNVHTNPVNGSQPPPGKM